MDVQQNYLPALQVPRSFGRSRAVFHPNHRWFVSLDEGNNLSIWQSPENIFLRRIPSTSYIDIDGDPPLFFEEQSLVYYGGFEEQNLVYYRGRGSIGYWDILTKSLSFIDCTHPFPDEFEDSNLSFEPPPFDERIYYPYEPGELASIAIRGHHLLTFCGITFSLCKWAMAEIPCSSVPGRLVKKIQLEQRVKLDVNQRIMSQKLSQDGQFLAIAVADGVEIWSTQTRKRILKVFERFTEVWGFRQDNQVLAVGFHSYMPYETGCLALFDTKSGECLFRELRSVHPFEFSFDGALFAMQTNDSLRLLDSETLEEVYMARPHA